MSRLFERRLERLAQTLGPRERVVLLLEQLDGDGDEERWSEGLSLAEREEFNHYVQLFNAANADLSVLINGVVQSVERLEVSLALLEALLGWRQDAKRLRKLLGRKLKQKDAFSALGRDGRVEELKAEITGDVGTVWQDLRAIDAVLSEIACELGVSDPLLRATRQSFDDAAERLEQLSEAFNLTPASEPEEARVEAVRECVRQRQRVSPTVYLYKEDVRWNRRGQQRW